MESLRQQTQAFVEDVLRGIDITIVALTASGARPLPYGKILCPRPLRTALGTNLAGGKEFVYNDKMFPIPLGFVFQLAAKFTPGSI